MSVHDVASPIPIKRSPLSSSVWQEDTIGNFDGPKESCLEREASSSSNDSTQPSTPSYPSQESLSVDVEQKSSSPESSQGSPRISPLKSLFANMLNTSPTDVQRSPPGSPQALAHSIVDTDSDSDGGELTRNTIRGSSDSIRTNNTVFGDLRRTLSKSRLLSKDSSSSSPPPLVKTPSMSLFQHFFQQNTLHHTNSHPHRMIRTGSVPVLMENNSNNSSYNAAPISSPPSRTARGRGPIATPPSPVATPSPSSPPSPIENRSSKSPPPIMRPRARSRHGRLDDLRNERTIRRSASESNLSLKYGVLEDRVIGRGANAVVKVSHKEDQVLHTETLYAIKEFAKPKSKESEKDYMKKVAAEFTIGSTLHHPNVVETVDLITTKEGVWEVMEYCSGGDLCTMIQDNAIEPSKADVYFAQLIHGVAYMHAMGVAHRDLKPENLMLDAKGCLKITDFGEAEVFQGPFGSTPQMSKRHVGSAPYMAPEEFTKNEFDPRSVDIWACGIIYLAMVHNRIPWPQPTMDDPCYKYYVKHRDDHKFPPIENLSRGPRELIHHMLNPDPSKRASMSEVRDHPWFRSIECLALEGSDCGANTGVAHPEALYINRHHNHSHASAIISENSRLKPDTSIAGDDTKESKENHQVAAPA
ncbi:hypothetical protein SmJEL517_g04834 [Synchytrium microbalum]|uniref:Protein kinase domain-containing protein n=1 Tax=Synchytrium microbalum TaxID=1806994 RepID=A0A507C1U7_9FUNG|nr:uncharacterized protein SmJEL517_g04834 [Synchytrium microbalum]TPX31926.1 hypothetical protein SmJEL517_g04834 [Synchytrium microbalum]